MSCASSPNPAPDWVNVQPNQDGIWFGIGITSISNKSDYREKARNKAYDEIGSQIKSQLESSFERIQTETNLNYDDYSKSVVNVRVELSISEIKIIDSYDDGNRYFVLAKLLKSDYDRMVRLKREKAVRTAIDYLASAEKNLSLESFNYLNKAMQEINPFIDLPLTAEYPKESGSKINLYSTLNIKAQDLSNRFLLSSDKTSISTAIGIRDEHTFKISLIDSKSGKAIKGIPLVAKMFNNDFTKNVTTNEDGEAVFHLFKVNNRTPVQYMDIGLDFSNLESELQPSDPAIVRIKIHAKAPTFYVNIQEKNLNQF